jgi:mono/diheme cytochrome c family protein
MRSTAAGVFTTAQAKRGEDTYANLCTGCHTASSHTGDAFVTGWAGRPVADLFNYLTESMPKSDPGTLTPAEYSAVVAYLLRLNGMPAGREELPSDAKALEKIRIDSSR